MEQQFKVVGLLHRHGWVCWLCGRWVDGAGVIVCPIVTAFIPVVAELLLRFLGAEPPKAEVHGLGFSWDNGEVGHANVSGVVCLDGCAWLWPTHFDEGLTEGDHFLRCGGESAKFSFGGRRHDKHHYWGDGENQTIVHGERAIFWR